MPGSSLERRASELLSWCVDDAGDVPAWVVALTGLSTREAIVREAGSRARFAEPARALERGP